MFFLILLISVNAQVFYGNKTNIKYCLRQQSEHCKECATMHRLSYDVESYRDVCEYLEHCAIQDGSNGCIKCKYGYRINDGVCQKGVEYGYYEDSTYKCFADAVMTPNGCRKCDKLPGCVKALRECADCYECDTTKYLKNPVNGKCVEGPETYFSCEPNYYYDKTKQICVYNPLDNCAIYDHYNGREDDFSNDYSKSKCIECKNGYVLRNSECVQSALSNCKELADDELNCKTCKPGYGLVDGKCGNCLDSNCYNCDGNVTSCYECKPGYSRKVFYSSVEMVNRVAVYKYSTTECMRDLEGCADHYFNHTSCKKCSANYYLKDGQCYACSYENCDDIPNTPFNENICRDYCKAVYNSSESKYEYISGETECLTSFSQGKYGCKTCYKHSYLTEDYECKRCDKSCKNGCAVSSTNCIDYDPLPEIKGCEVYNSNQDSCAKCKPLKYRLENGKCIDVDPTDSYICESDFEVKDNGKCLLCQNTKNSDYFVPNDYECTKGEQH